MTPPDLQLLDDVETPKAMALAMFDEAAHADVFESELADLKARNVDADERIERLAQILKPSIVLALPGDQKSSGPRHRR